MRELGTYIAKTYLEAYEKEGKVLDNNIIPVMMAKITYRLNAETNDRALKLSEFSGLSTEMESLLSHVKSILEQDLYIKMKSAELDRKTDQSPARQKSARRWRSRQAGARIRRSATANPPVSATWRSPSPAGP